MMLLALIIILHVAATLQPISASRSWPALLVPRLLADSSIAASLEVKTEPVNAAATQSHATPLNHHDMQQALQLMGNKDCMSTWQLDDIVEAAAFSTTGTNDPSAINDLNAINGSNGNAQKAVVMTSNDMRGMGNLFQTFMKGVETARGGDFSQHVVVVGNGIPAYLYCDSQRGKHKHHCVLDKMCISSDHNNMQYMSKVYIVACLTKVMWVREVVRRGVSVLWLDMDVVTLRNPLPFFQMHHPEGDFLMANEQPWCYEHDNNGGRGMYTTQWIPGRLWWQNSGVYYVRPTAAGRAIMDFWVEKMHDRFLKDNKWDVGDQEVLYYWMQSMSTPDLAKNAKHTMQRQVADGTWKEVGELEFDFTTAKLFKLGHNHFNNLCGGLCGFNVTSCARQKIASRFLPDGSLQCAVSSGYLDEWYTMHMICQSSIDAKKKAMEQLLTVKATEEDGAQWWQPSLTDQHA